MYYAKGSGLTRMNLLPILKSALQGRKVMLWVWLGHCDIHFEFLSHRQAFNAPDSLIGEMLCFSFDNAKSHPARFRHEKILDLGWSVLPYATYSANLAASDFHLLFL